MSASFKDGLGERIPKSDAPRSDAAEMLCLRTTLTSVPAFEFALREQVSRLAAFRHGCYRQVRSVERLADGSATLAVVSDAADGIRLSDLIARAEQESIPLDIETALCLLRQLVPAVVLLHAPDAAHGALAPERIVVTPAARIVVVEHVLGSARERLRWTPDRYWSELRVAVTRAAGPIRFDQRTDGVALGTVALSLILGRLLRDDEPPAKLQSVVASAWAVSARGGLEPLPAGLRNWLMSALQLDSKRAFATAADAQAELEAVLGETEYLAAPATLEAFLAKIRPAAPTSVPGPTSVPPVTSVPAPSPASAPRVAVVPQPEPPTETRSEPPSMRAFRRLRWQVAAAVVALVGVAGAGVFAARRGSSAPAPAVTPDRGTLVVNTNPTGAKVFVDGTQRGEDSTRTMSVVMTAGALSNASAQPAAPERIMSRWRRAKTTPAPGGCEPDVFADQPQNSRNPQCL